MISTGLILIDRARARFFVLESSDDDPDAPPRLLECAALTDSEASLADQQLFTDLKGGRNRAAGGGPAHAYDDHRARHHLEETRRFARRVAEQARSFVEERALLKLVLVAEPQTLGVVRTQLTPKLPPDIAVHEVAEDLGKRSVSEIQQALELRGVLEPRRIGSAAYQPRGRVR